MTFRFLVHGLFWHLLAWLVLSTSHLSLAASDRDLKPIPDQSRLSGRLRAMGIVTAGDPDRIRSMGTGFLVSTCHVLTAGHVIAPGKGKAAVGMPVRFVPTMGNVAVALAQRAVWGKVVAAGQDFVSRGAAGEVDVRNDSQDWSLIELDHPIDNVTPFKLLYPGATLASDTSISAVGYTANGRMLSVNVDENCGIRQDFHGADWLPGLVVASCAVRSGMSGGPLLIDTGTQLITVGIIIERVEVGKKVATIAVSTRSFADNVAAVMRSSNVCAVGQPFALPPKSLSEPAAARSRDAYPP